MATGLKRCPMDGVLKRKRLEMVRRELAGYGVRPLRLDPEQGTLQVGDQNLTIRVAGDGGYLIEAMTEFNYSECDVGVAEDIFARTFEELLDASVELGPLQHDQTRRLCARSLRRVCRSPYECVSWTTWLVNWEFSK